VHSPVVCWQSPSWVHAPSTQIWAWVPLPSSPHAMVWVAPSAQDGESSLVSPHALSMASELTPTSAVSHGVGILVRLELRLKKHIRTPPKDVGACIARHRFRTCSKGAS